MALSNLKVSGVDPDGNPFGNGARSSALGAVKRIQRGTDQQEALWSEAVDGLGNILVEARAGCGKSSSAREAMWRMLEKRPGLRIRYAVYNKANADEFRAACPPGVEVETTHKFGLQALQLAFRSKIEAKKTYLILDESQTGRNLPRYMRKSVSLLVGHAKNHGLRPGRAPFEEESLDKSLADLLVHYDVNAYGRPSVIIGWAATVLAKSVEWVELVDFDDMIYLPALLKVQFPEVDALFLDEFQDANVSQIALAGRMGSSGRTVVIGDRFQAINIWRGADEDALDKTVEMLNDNAEILDLWCEHGLDTNKAPLTITFRCPKSHVALANEYVSDLQAHDSAVEGEIAHLRWEQLLDSVRPGDLVICPTNAPIISACLKQVARSQPATVRGRAIGEQLLSVLRGLPECRTVADACRGVEHWRSKELLRLSGMDGSEVLIESVQDRSDGLQAILSACSVPSEAESIIGQVFSDEKGRSGTTTYSTIHRAKGDEAERVFLIQAPGKAPKQDWEKRQTRNLAYVGLTRSSRRLTFVEAPPKNK